MGSDAYVWVDLEFPAEPKDCMNRWKQSPLDGGLWSDWGAFGVTAGVLKGFETVAAALAQAARHAALQRFKGGTSVLSVALGPTQVKVRASLDDAQADWWHVLAVLARVAGPLLAYGEFGWALARDGQHEGFVVTIGEGASKARPMSPEELRRLERHPAVIEIEAKRAAAAAAPPVPLPVPTPRSPGARTYRRRPMSHAAPLERTPLPGEEEERSPDAFGEEAAGGAAEDEAGADGDALSAAGTDDEGGEEGSAGGGDDEGAGEERGDEDAPPAASRRPRAAKGAAAKPAAGKPAAAKGAAAKGAAAKPAAAKPAAARAPKAGKKPAATAARRAAHAKAAPKK